MKRIIHLLFTIFFVFGVCQFAQSQPTSGRVELTIGIPSLSTETFHPFRSHSDIKMYAQVMYDYLVAADLNGAPEPGIAYKWEESPDHLSWTFYIRDNAKFHDGNPVTLEDVKYSLDTILDEKNVNARTQFIAYLDAVEIKKPDKIVVHLKRPFNTLLYYLTPGSAGGGIILPKEYLEKYGVEYFNEHPIGTGPYKFIERKAGTSIKFEAMDSHWRIGKPGYKYITFKGIPEETTRVAALKRGEIDITMLSRTRTDEVTKAGFPIISRDVSFDLALFFIGVGEEDNPIGNKKVRQALAYAIDREAIAKYVFRGQARPIGHSFYMSSSSIGVDPTIPVTPYDPKKAKQLLSEAGYADGFTHYHYVHEKEVPEMLPMAEAFASYWEAIGIKVKIIELEPSSFRSIYTRKTPAPGPATVVFVCESTPIAKWRPLFHSDHKKYVWSRFGDTTMDKLIDNFDNAVNVDAYIKAHRACEAHARGQYWTNGLIAVPAPFATAKDVPTWNLGKGTGPYYRFEYIGATPNK